MERGFDGLARIFGEQRQRAENREHRAKSIEQRAENIEQRTRNQESGNRTNQALFLVSFIEY